MAEEESCPKTDDCESCVATGVQMRNMELSYREATPVIYRENIQGLVKVEDLKVPSSELALHTGAAGKEIISMCLMGVNTAAVIFRKEDGGCGFISGDESELLSMEARNKVHNIWRKSGPSPVSDLD